MSGGDHPDAHRGQMEGADPAGSDGRHQTLRRTEKVHRYSIPEGADCPAWGHVGERPADPQGLCRGAAAGGVYPHRDRLQPEADPGRHVGLGR